MVNLAARFHDAKWLLSKGYSPSVYLFRNLESGQVIYSQFPYFAERQIKKQFQRPNWQNRLPSTRKDIWRIMSVVSFDNHEKAVDAYNALVELRHLRDVGQKKLANSFRKKNEDGNIWYSAQYRPTWTQESVADLTTVIDELKLENTKIFWEDLWRKGDDKYWNQELVEHRQLEKFSPREESVVLKRLGEKVKAEFALLKESQNAETLS
ncbi:Mhr1 protein [Saccharomycopsis crataegensis]|uniref:Large ribosomal subunit protein mL67 n=1 Tax=Saccharomycopsis crataegensis TaxID=43959 RepID=A0AAV5QLC0_9ASCO|nr:Mhr1 protein [Saccharomycopsis crataegensis]